MIRSRHFRINLLTNVVQQFVHALVTLERLSHPTSTPEFDHPNLTARFLNIDLRHLLKVQFRSTCTPGPDYFPVDHFKTGP